MTAIINDRDQAGGPDYHFSFSNDNQRLKFTVNNNGFRAVQFHVEPVRTIDLSAGTRKLEEIFFVDCLELKNIDWPVNMDTAIRRISIANAASMTKLDLVGLTELEELTIVNCPQLKEIVGISQQIKKVNIDGVAVSTLQLPSPSSLKSFNLRSDAASFTINVDDFKNLEKFSLELPSADAEATTSCKLNRCDSLEKIYVEAEKAKVILEASGCEKLSAAYIRANERSAFKGFPESDQFQFLYFKHGNQLKSNLPETHSAKMVDKFKLGVYDYHQSAFHFTEHKDDTETILQQYGAKKANRRQLMAMIRLLGVPEANFTPQLKKYKSKKKDDKRKTDKKKPAELALLLKDDRFPILFSDQDEAEKITKKDEEAFYVYSEKEMSDWLKNIRKKKYPILLVKEKDNNHEDVHEVINSLLEDAKSVKYKGQRYKLSEKNRIIIIGKPENLLKYNHWHLIQDHLLRVGSLFILPRLARIKAVNDAKFSPYLHSNPNIGATYGAIPGSMLARSAVTDYLERYSESELTSITAKIIEEPSDHDIDESETTEVSVEIDRGDTSKTEGKTKLGLTNVTTSEVEVNLQRQNEETQERQIELQRINTEQERVKIALARQDDSIQQAQRELERLNTEEDRVRAELSRQNEEDHQFQVELERLNNEFTLIRDQIDRHNQEEHLSRVELDRLNEEEQRVKDEINRINEERDRLKGELERLNTHDVDNPKVHIDKTTLIDNPAVSENEYVNDVNVESEAPIDPSSTDDVISSADTGHTNDHDLTNHEQNPRVDQSDSNVNANVNRDNITDTPNNDPSVNLIADTDIQADIPDKRINTHETPDLDDLRQFNDTDTDEDPKHKRSNTTDVLSKDPLDKPIDNATQSSGSAMVDKINSQDTPPSSIMPKRDEATLTDTDTGIDRNDTAQTSNKDNLDDQIKNQQVIQGKDIPDERINLTDNNGDDELDKTSAITTPSQEQVVINRDSKTDTPATDQLSISEHKEGEVKSAVDGIRKDTLITPDDEPLDVLQSNVDDEVSDHDLDRKNATDLVSQPPTADRDKETEADLDQADEVERAGNIHASDDQHIPIDRNNTTDTQASVTPFERYDEDSHDQYGVNDTGSRSNELEEKNPNLDKKRHNVTDTHADAKPFERFDDSGSDQVGIDKLSRDNSESLDHIDETGNKRNNTTITASKEKSLVDRKNTSDIKSKVELDKRSPTISTDVSDKSNLEQSRSDVTDTSSSDELSASQANQTDTKATVAEPKRSTTASTDVEAGSDLSETRANAIDTAASDEVSSSQTNQAETKATVVEPKRSTTASTDVEAGSDLSETRANATDTAASDQVSTSQTNQAETKATVTEPKRSTTASTDVDAGSDLSETHANATDTSASDEVSASQTNQADTKATVDEPKRSATASTDVDAGPDLSATRSNAIDTAASDEVSASQTNQAETKATFAEPKRSTTASTDVEAGSDLSETRANASDTAESDEASASQTNQADTKATVTEPKRSTTASTNVEAGSDLSETRANATNTAASDDVSTSQTNQADTKATVADPKRASTAFTDVDAKADLSETRTNTSDAAASDEISASQTNQAETKATVPDPKRATPASTDVKAESDLTETHSNTTDTAASDEVSASQTNQADTKATDAEPKRATPDSTVEPLTPIVDEANISKKEAAASNELKFERKESIETEDKDSTQKQSPSISAETSKDSDIDQSLLHASKRAESTDNPLTGLDISDLPEASLLHAEKSAEQAKGFSHTLFHTTDGTKVETIQLPLDLLSDAKKLAEAITKLLETAKSSMDKKPGGTKLLRSTNKQAIVLYGFLSAIQSPLPHIPVNSLLRYANEVSQSIEQLIKSAQSELKADSPALFAKPEKAADNQPREEQPIELMVGRDEVVNILQNVLSPPASKATDSAFQKGFNTVMRKIIDSLVNRLKNHEDIDEETLNAAFKDLSKHINKSKPDDKVVSKKVPDKLAVLEAIKEPLHYYLCQHPNLDQPTQAKKSGKQKE